MFEFDGDCVTTSEEWSMSQPRLNYSPEDAMRETRAKRQTNALSWRTWILMHDNNPIVFCQSGHSNYRNVTLFFVRFLFELAVSRGGDFRTDVTPTFSASRTKPKRALFFVTL